MPTSLSAVLSAERKPNPAWPLTVPLVGLPVWWLLGVWQLVLLAMAIPMGIYLIRQRSIAVPRGFGLWLLWMAWLLTGLLVLQVDAPSAVPGFNPNRYISFMFRYSWYVLATIVGLYVVNTRHVLSSKKIIRAVAWVFVWCAIGGVLGIFASGIDFPSALQVVLPDSVAKDSFVNSLTRVRVAQVQDVLGAPLPRPTAPFFYTNEWGFATAISLPFFIAAWWGRGWAWRGAMVIVLGAGVFAILSSLNRGVWLAVLAAAGVAIVQTAMQGRYKAIAVSAVVMLATITVVLFSPLSDVVTERLDNGVSDEVRGNLAITAVESAALGSPIVGFGSTRDVAGTFGSIAGGATDACPRCEAPPLGTHGQFWLVTFGAGLVGASLYIAFIVSQFVRTVKVRSTFGMGASASLLMLVVTLPFYNSVGVPLYLGFVGVGLLARESSLAPTSLQGLIRPVTGHLSLLGVIVLIGGLAGVGLNMVLDDPVIATRRVLVPQAELVPVPGVRGSTLDSEAELVRSEATMSAVAAKLDIPEKEVRRGLSVGAEPNSRVLLVNYESDSAENAKLGAGAIVVAFLEERESLLEASGERVRESYTLRETSLEALYRSIRESVLTLPSARFQTVLDDIEGERVSVAGVLSDNVGRAPARAISDAVVIDSGGRGVVRGASGLALGLLVGIATTQLYDRHVALLRRGRMRRRSDDVAVVAKMGESGFHDAMVAVSNYTPIAGVLADSDSASSMTIAAELDRHLPKGSHAGTRTLLIVDQRSRSHAIQQSFKRMKREGMDPVGVVVHECNKISSRDRVCPRARDSDDER